MHIVKNSARNVIKGTIKKLTVAAVNAGVTVEPPTGVDMVSLD